VRRRGRRAQQVETALVEPVAPASACSCTPAPRSPPDVERQRHRAMKFVDEFRDAELGRALAGEILSLVEPGRHYKLMEVCGGHTHSIYKYGVDDLLPANVELVHGPGCPVCVIPMGRVDDGIALAHEDGVIFTCFGDMMRVPGSNGSLLEAKAAGADVRMVYSPLDALRIAKQNPDREVVFFAIGFETTAPSTALTLKRARAEGVKNFSCDVQPRHDRAAAARAARVSRPAARRVHRPRSRLDVVGARPFEFIPADYGKPIVIAGFEPLDILQSIVMILRQLARGAARSRTSTSASSPTRATCARSR
jgi:hydrogenase expression/formation protein HypD